MSTATLRRRPPRTAELWSPVRQRVAVGRAAVTALLVAVALAAGLVFAFHDRNVAPHGATPGVAMAPTVSSAVGLTNRQRQDMLAAAPMPDLPAAAANPRALLPVSAMETLPLPAARTHRGVVRTGFPHTAIGAIAQLAAIDETAIAGMNPAQVSQVYADWAVVGADPIALWSVYQFVSQTLDVSGIPDGSSQLQADYSVTEAQVKGEVGEDFVVACVNGEFDASLADNTVRIGAADCARMVWTGSRWQIGQGSQPASPPNAWPGTAEAQQVGWQPVTHG